MANSALSPLPDVQISKDENTGHATLESAVELSSEEQAAGVMLADPRWG